MKESEESAPSPFSAQDIEAVVALLGTVAGMEHPIPDRRRTLLDGLCRIAGCDAWVWLHSRFDAVQRQAMSFSTLDGGFATDSERLIYYRTAFDPYIQRIQAPEMLQALQAGVRHVTVGSRQIVPPSLDTDPAIIQFRETCRYEPALWSIYVLAPGVLSGIGLMVERGKPMPGDRERALVHLVTSQIDWLHRAGTEVQANSDDLLDLSARERGVLFLLMSGDSRKQIASKLKISPNTVADHVQAIYRQFGVNSRGELLGRFITGGMATPMVEPKASLE